MARDSTTVAVVGGAVAGLAAAERLCDSADVTLFERQSYDEKRVNCGEAINEASLVPLAKTPENGFVNDVDGYRVRIFRDRTHGPADPPLGTAAFPCKPGYVTDRNVVERSWAERVASRGVDVREDTALTPAEFREVCETSDYVVDATGQPSLSVRTFGDRDAYTGDMVAVNADVEGDFSGMVSTPEIYFEGYVGYAWVFPKSETRANVGIGWAGEDRPDDYYAAFEGACERNDIPVASKSATNIYTIPRGPSLDPADTYWPDRGLLLVGDAAGIANRYQGEGIWVEHGDSDLLAAVASAIDGLTIDDITRSPRRVVARVARHPTLAARVLSNRGMLRRFADAYTDSWEYTSRRRA